MSRGIGVLQREILAELAHDHERYEEDERGLWMTELREFLGGYTDIRQLRRAVRALESRGLVVITKHHMLHQRGSALLVRITGAGLAAAR